MKFLISILALIVFSNQCGQKSDTPHADSQSPSAQEELIVSYEAQSRGFYEKVWADQDSISFAASRDLSTVKTKPILKTDWEELVVLKNALNLKTLPQLKAPSEKRFSDGAAIGRLIIKTDKDEFLSAEFDHGNPPKEIKTVVNKLLSLKEKG